MRAYLLLLLLVVSSTSYAIADLTETSPCPGLVSEYGYTQFEDALVVTDDMFSSVEDCQRVANFYYQNSNDFLPVFDVSKVPFIVDNVFQPVAEEPPFLFTEALLHWLKNLGFEKHADSLKGFFDEYMPSKESAEIFFTVMLWLIVAGTVGVVVREFYLAGMLRLPRFNKKRLRTMEKHATSEIQWQHVIALPVREQMAALLRYSIQSLVMLGIIPASKSYTNRELIPHLEKTDSLKAGMFLKQLQLAEPVIYGDQPVTDEALAMCRQSAKSMRDA